jgi:ABC-type uncharacterized transport system ATPase subunit
LDAVEQAVDLERGSAAFLVERLTSVYRDGTKALDGLSRRVTAGVFFRLLGPNGAVKTLMIGATSGPDCVPRGRLFILGSDAVTGLRTQLLAAVDWCRHSNLLDSIMFRWMPREAGRFAATARPAAR